jgi:CRP-like cAMP-binding protein
MAFFDGGRHPATARAALPARITEIPRAEFDGYCEANPAVALKLYRYLTETVAAQTRLTVDRYLRTVEWSMQISAARDLNLHRLVADEAELRLDLTTGAEVRGTLLQFDSSPAGYELLLRGPGNELIIIPYHAIAKLTLAGEDWRKPDDSIDPIA